MKLEMLIDVALGLKSAAQIARRVSEAWGAANLYCAACPQEQLLATPPNTRAIDFRCTSCGAGYQLKCGRSWNETRVPDAAYSAMVEAIRADSTPNLLLMQYSPIWHVQNLLLIPSFFFTESAIEKRRPLADTARRAGWVGCNILLSAISEDGKLRMVRDTVPVDRGCVRSQYQRIRGLVHVPPEVRGWTLNVLRVVRELQRGTFELADVYAKEQELSVLYPGNRHVRAKIRQQLQVLRDLNLIRFEGRGRYSIVAV